MKAGESETLLVRRYRPEDRDTVLRLHELGLRETGTFIEDRSLDEDLLDIEGAYLNDGGEFLVGTLNGRLVAMGALKRTSPERAEVRRMRVEHAFQRRGYGRAILEALERRAEELGCATLHLDTTARQEAARRLYEGRGYREVRRGKMGSFEGIFYEKELIQHP